MLECHACFRRFLRALGSPQELSARPAPTTRRLLHTSPRHLQGTTYAPRSRDTSYRSPRDRPSSPRRDSQPFRPTREGEGDLLTQGVPKSTRWQRDFPPRKKTGYPERREVPGSGELTNRRGKARDEDAIRQERFLREELKYITYPAQLADHVEGLLRKNDYEKALAMTRLSSRALANTVSWNYMIEYLMKQGKRKDAIALFNEMKKRAQKPNSQTYTILLRGLAEGEQHMSTLGTALTLYHSISAPNSGLSPNIIHTNALLRLCSMQLDLDSMFDIVSKLPENGSYAANSWTFTRLLQTMREKAIKDSNGISDANASALRREETIIEARRMWAVIIGRWRKADIVVDEELVCSMGRLLLIGGRPRDWDDVLSLIQQTMNIARLVPRLGSEARHAENHPRIRGPHVAASLQTSSSQIVIDGDEPAPGSEFDTNFGLEPKQYKSEYSRSKVAATTAYAKPGNNTLSLILDACLKTAQKTSALDYWRLLTNPAGPYVVVPDSDNVHMLLRILRASRASTETLKILLNDMPELRISYLPKTFRIAMSACVRDALNPSALETASRILDLMQSRFQSPDLNVLQQYADVAKGVSEHQAAVFGSHGNLLAKGMDGDKTKAPPHVKSLMTAIDRLAPVVFDAIRTGREELALGIPRVDAAGAEEVVASERGRMERAPLQRRAMSERRGPPPVDREALVSLMTSTMRLYDKVLDQVRNARRDSPPTEKGAPVLGMTAEIEARYTEQKKRLSKEVTRIANRAQEVKRQEEMRVAQRRKDERRREEGISILRPRESIAERVAKRETDMEEAAWTKEEHKEVRVEAEEEEEVDMGGRKWVAGVKPKSGVARALAREREKATMAEVD